MHQLIIRLAPDLRIISQTNHDHPVTGFVKGQFIGLGSPPASYVIEEVGVQVGSGQGGPLRTILVVAPGVTTFDKQGPIGGWVGNG